jgi:hypothetical protein
MNKTSPFAVNKTEQNGRLLQPSHADRIAVLPGTTLIDNVTNALGKDQVVLVHNVDIQDAERLLAETADRFGLLRKLEVQAGFAPIQGHRERIGKYFMTVNQRSAYQFIPPHSEGTVKTDMQLAAFYCFQNSTDGGETILFNADAGSPSWSQLFEVTKKISLEGRKLSPTEITIAKIRFQLDIPQDCIGQYDRILRELPSPVPGIRLFDVITKTNPVHSQILGRSAPVYWDNAASTDFDSGKEYFELLSGLGILKLPPGGMDMAQLDNAFPRRVWSSGLSFRSLFRGYIRHKLTAGELVIFNNLTWTHSTSNWTPDSGVRRVAAAFA